MATVSRELAEKEIARVKTQKRPKVYCIVRHQNRLLGDSEKGTYSGYAICRNLAQFNAVVQSPVIGGIDILWASEQCKRDEKEAELDEDRQEAVSLVNALR